MEYETVSKILGDLAEMNTREVIFLGEGEPLLHPRFFDIVSEAKQRGFRITAYTNGTLLNHQRAEELVISGLDRLKVSFWASNEDSYGKQYPNSKSGQFTAILEGIHALNEMKRRKNASFPQVFMHFPISKSNHIELEDIVGLAEELNVDGLTVAPVFSVDDRLNHLQFPPSLINHTISLLEGLEPRLKKAGIEHNFPDLKVCLRFGNDVWNYMPCYIGFFHAKISIDGSVHPCCRCNFPIGNLHDQRFRSIWGSENYRQLRSTMMSTAGFKSFIQDNQCVCTYCSSIPNNNRMFKVARRLPYCGG